MLVRKIAVYMLSVVIAGTAAAQTKENIGKPKKEAEEALAPKRKEYKEQFKIIIDSNRITVNGKDIDELQDRELDEPGKRRMLAFSPRLREMMRLRGNQNLFLPDLDGISANKAVLGVVSEKAEGGAKIVSVTKESPAEKAGLQKDDIITKIDDAKVEDSEGLYNLIGKYKPKDKVSITYLRNGKQAMASAVLYENNSGLGFNPGNNMNRNFNFNMPMPRGNDFSFNMSRKPRLGMQVQDLETSKGVKVLEVNDETPASKAGLQKGDIITAVGDKKIGSVDELKENISGLKEGDTVKLDIERNGKAQSVQVKLPKKLKTADL